MIRQVFRKNNFKIRKSNVGQSLSPAVKTPRSSKYPSTQTLHESGSFGELGKAVEGSEQSVFKTKYHSGKKFTLRPKFGSFCGAQIDSLRREYGNIQEDRIVFLQSTLGSRVSDFDGDREGELRTKISELVYFIENLDHQLKVAILNGPTVGSTAAVPFSHDYVIATEGSLYSCPEVAYGLVPHCGNMNLMKQVNEKYPGLGTAMGIAGLTIRGSDLVHLGMATHFAAFNAAGLADYFFNEMDTQVDLPHKQKIIDTLSDLFEQQDLIPDFTLNSKLPEFQFLFDDLPDLQTFTKRVNESHSETAQLMKDYISQCDPIALDVAIRALYFAKDMSLPDILNMEFTLFSNLLHRKKNNKDLPTLQDYFKPPVTTAPLCLPEQLRYSNIVQSSHLKSKLRFITPNQYQDRQEKEEFRRLALMSYPQFDSLSKEDKRDLYQRYQNLKKNA